MTTTNDRPATETKPSAAQKAATTHEVAMQIIDSEVSAREQKTERLRKLRLQQEADAPAPAAAKPRKRRG